MSHRRAKRIRQLLLPEHPVGTSRGRVVRELTEYTAKTPFRNDPGRRNKYQRKMLILKPESPRYMIQRVKKNYGRG